MAQGFTIQAILKAILGSDLKFLKSGEENRKGVISFATWIIRMWWPCGNGLAPYSTYPCGKN